MIDIMVNVIYEQLIDLLDDIELYDFECEGGPLVNCVEWIGLRELVNDLYRE